MTDGRYQIELTDPLLGKRCVGTFNTRQTNDGMWYATGWVVAPDGRRRSYGCSKDYEVEADAIHALCQAECAKDIIWL